MTVIAEDSLTSLPGDWADQVLRAYTVMTAPSPFLTPIPLSQMYTTVEFADLHSSLVAVGDDLGASWLVLQTMDDLVAALDGADEFGLRQWLERLHPRGEGGMFREVRGRRKAAQADRALKMHLLRKGITRLPDKKEYRRDLGEEVDSPLYRDIERTRLRVQEMLDNGASIKSIREQLGLDVGWIRREAARDLRYHQWRRQDDIAMYRERLEKTDDPAERKRIQGWIDAAERELNPMVHYRKAPPGEAFRHVVVPPPFTPRPQIGYPSIARYGLDSPSAVEMIGQPRSVDLRPFPKPDPNRPTHFPPTPRERAMLEETWREKEEKRAKQARRRGLPPPEPLPTPREKWEAEHPPGTGAAPWGWPDEEPPPPPPPPTPEEVEERIRQERWAKVPRMG